LHQVGHQSSAATVEVNPVTVEAPTVESPNLVVSLAQEELRRKAAGRSSAVERQDPKYRERPARAGLDQLVDPLINRDLAHRFFAGDVPDDRAALFDASVRLGLKVIR
jgi:hypothetical protein